MNPSNKYLRRAFILLIVVGIFYVLVTLINETLLPPKTFQAPYRISIESGQTLFSISKELYDDGAISSQRIFEMLMLSLGSDKNISHGEYYFEKPVGVLTLALRISGRNYGIDLARVTFPEGFTNKQIGERLEKELHNFDNDTFMKLAKGKEGYLFPDTYTFFPWSTPESVFESLTTNFDKKIEPLQSDIKKSGRSLSDIIIMASIIEKEANGENDRELISGILWNRIDAGIALQVDAPFIYLLGKESSELTRADLATKSPYNTYVNKGLPPTPINNPGLAAISAALHPQKSKYFYYLHDKDGNIHYAKTFSEHKKNIRDYLR